MILRSLNLGVAFLLELAMLVAFGVAQSEIFLIGARVGKDRICLVAPDRQPGEFENGRVGRAVILRVPERRPAENKQMPPVVAGLQQVLLVLRPPIRL